MIINGSVRLGLLGVALWLVQQYEGPGAGVIRPASIVFATIAGFEWLRRDFEFAPFTITIMPTRAFLIEHGIASNEELDQLEESVGNADPAYVSLREGVTFTVLNLGLSSTDGNRIYWNGGKAFTTEIEYSVEMRGGFQSQGAHQYLPCFFYVRGVRDGLEIGYELPGADKHAACLLPYCEFGTARFRGGRLSASRCARTIAQAGWRSGESAGAPNAPRRLSHNQALVWWSFI